MSMHNALACFFSKSKVYHGDASPYAQQSISWKEKHKASHILKFISDKTNIKTKLNFQEII